MKEPARELGPVEAALESAIADAKDAGALTVRHAAIVEGARVLARKIDTEDELRMAAYELVSRGELAKPPSIDNVSLPTLLNYCAALGLVPGKAAPEKKPEAGGGGKLLSLTQGVKKPKRA